MSDPATRVLALIKQGFPHYKLFLEHCVNHMGQRLFFDFYLPELGVIIEVQGEQHYRFIKHFHGTYYNYVRQRRRDALKAEWAVSNGIRLVEICSTNIPTDIDKFLDLCCRSQLPSSKDDDGLERKRC